MAITDATAHPQADARIEATLMVDDFFPSGAVVTRTDAAGHTQLTFPAAAAEQGSGRRFLHVTAGPRYPLVERVLAIDVTDSWPRSPTRT